MGKVPSMQDSEPNTLLTEVFRLSQGNAALPLGGVTDKQQATPPVITTQAHAVWPLETWGAACFLLPIPSTQVWVWSPQGLPLHLTPRLGGSPLHPGCWTRPRGTSSWLILQADQIFKGQHQLGFHSQIKDFEFKVNVQSFIQIIIVDALITEIYLSLFWIFWLQKYKAHYLFRRCINTL